MNIYIYTIINLFQPSAKLLFLHNFAGFVRSSGHFWDQALLMQAIAHFHWWNIMGAVQVDTSGTPNKAQQVKLRSSLAQHYQHLNAKVPGLLPSAGTGTRAAGEGNFSMAGACCRSQGLVPTHVQEIQYTYIIYICYNTHVYIYIRYITYIYNYYYYYYMLLCIYIYIRI